MTLSLEVRPFPEVSIEAVQEINEMKIRLYPAIGKKPKKAAVEIPVMLERVEPEERLISAGDLQTLETWYNYFQSERSKNCRYLLFAKSSNPAIGSGFCSSNVHFTAFLINGINEFTIVYLNRGNCIFFENPYFMILIRQLFSN